MKAPRLRNLKVAATLALALAILTSGAGFAAQWALTAEPPETKQETPPQPPGNKDAAGKPAEDKKARVDRYNDPLPNGAVARLGTVAFRHGRVRFGDSLTFTPDGKHLVSTGRGWVRRWDVATGYATVNLGDGKAVPLMVTADGKRARIGTADGEGTTEYDLDSGKELQTCRHFDFPKTDASFWFPNHLSPDGKMFADFNSNGEFTLWNAGAGVVLHHFKPSARPYTAFAFAPDGTTVLVGEDAHTFRVFDLITAKELRSFGIDNAKAVAGMKISPDGKWLVSVGGKRQENGLNGVWPDDHFLRLWDLAKGAVVHTIDFAEDHDARRLLFTPDSGTVIAALEGNKSGKRDAVRTWDVATGKPGRAWTEDPAMGLIVAVSPDGKTLATLAECGVIRLWDMQTGKEKHPLDATPCPVMDVCWTDAKTIMTIGRDDSALRDWEAATGKPLGSPRALQKPGFLQTFSPGGKLVVAIELIDENSQVTRLYDPANGKLLLEQPGYRAAVSPNGKWVAIGCKDEPIRIIDIDTGKRIQTVTLDAEDRNSEFYLFVFTSDGRSLIAQGEDTISTWDARTGDQKSSWSMRKKELLKKPADPMRNSWERIEAIAASPDGSTIAFSLLKDKDQPEKRGMPDWFGRIAILETASGKLLHEIDMDKESFKHATFSPDGKLLAAGGRRTIRIWDVATGKAAGKFEGHLGDVMGLAFSPDGMRLASASYDSTVLVWDVAK